MTIPLMQFLPLLGHDFNLRQVSEWAIVLTSYCTRRVAVGKLNNCAANRVMNTLFTDLFRNKMLLFEYLMFMLSSTLWIA